MDYELIYAFIYQLFVLLLRIDYYQLYITLCALDATHYALLISPLRRRLFSPLPLLIISYAYYAAIIADITSLRFILLLITLRALMSLLIYYIVSH